MKRPFVKGLLERLEAALVAAAFAEESEPEAARWIAAQPRAFDGDDKARRS